MKKGKEKEGISLIVLVITIIVIIILAAAVILTLNNNNPINEANQARYESDVANMQAIFTNTVAKVMAQNQCTIKVNAGELNSVKTIENGVSSTEGRVNYILDNPLDSSNENGTIIFNTGTNTATTYYTGKILPLYTAGETIWYVDSEGVISLKIDDKEYGKGDKTDKPAGEVEGEEIVSSDNPMLQMWSYNSTTDFHVEEYRTKITKIKFAVNVKVPNNKIESWDVSQAKDGSVMAWVENDGNNGYILTIAGRDKIIANPLSYEIFYDFSNVKTIENLNLLDTSQVTSMVNMFYNCINLTSLDVSNFNTSNVTNMGGLFSNCENLTNLNVSNFDTSKVTIMTNMFFGCESLTSLDLSNFDTSKVENMQSMFGRCINLIDLNLSNFNFYNVKDILHMFYYCEKLNIVVNLNVNSLTSYTDTFKQTATKEGAKVIVNYTTGNLGLVNQVIATKSENSNVVKGTFIY